MNDKKALFFDCYGTLVDWESGILQALLPFFAQRGIPAEPEEVLALFARFETEAEAGDYRPYRQVLAMVMDQFAQYWQFPISAAEREILAESLGQWPLFPDTRIALQKLATRFSLGLLSNVDDDLIAKTRKKIAVDFTWVLTAQQIGAYKPSPQNFAAILSETGVPKERILHCAQSVFHDCVPATQLGLDCVWVDRRQGAEGGATPQAIWQGPDPWVKKVGSLAELADWLCRD
jgi:2-haloacid dehalogenase